MKKVWRDIKGFEGLYQVDDVGDVKSLARKRKNQSGNKNIILKPVLTCGYAYYSLYKNRILYTTKRSHLVWFYYNNENPPTNLDLDHIDNNKLNDSITNLQLLTRAENIGKGHRSHGRKYDLPTGVYPSKNKYRSQYWNGEKREHLGSFNSPEEAHKAYLEAINA